MTAKLQILLLSSISTQKDYFKLRRAEPDDALIASVRRYGVFTPLIVWEQDDAYLLVSGFKRFSALRQIGEQKAPAVVYPAETEPLDLFALQVQSNRLTGELDPIQVSQILQTLQTEFDLDEQTIIRTWLPQLGFGRNPKVLQRYRPLVNLTLEQQTAVAAGAVSIDVANAILDFNPAEQQTVWSLLQTLRLGKNRQHEYVALLSDIADASGRSVAEIIAGSDFQSILQDEKRTPSQKADQIKQVLWKLRYPRYAQTLQAFDQIIKDARAPRSIKILPPPYFETETFQLILSFESQADFQNALAELKKLVATDTIKKLTDLP